MITVKLNYIRHSAKKLRPITRIMLGKNVDWAINTTAVMPQDSAGFVNKLLKMASAAAAQKELDPKTMVIGAMMATEGPKIKRMRPNARGRSNKYQKHLAHLTITLKEGAVKAAKPTARAKKESKIISEMKNISVTRSQKGNS